MKCQFPDCSKRAMYELAGRPFDVKNEEGKRRRAYWAIRACKEHAEKMLIPFLQMPNTHGRKLTLTEFVYDEEEDSFAHRQLIV